MAALASAADGSPEGVDCPGWGMSDAELRRGLHAKHRINIYSPDGRYKLTCREGKQRVNLRVYKLNDEGDGYEMVICRFKGVLCTKGNDDINAFTNKKTGVTIPSSNPNFRLNFYAPITCLEVPIHECFEAGKAQYRELMGVIQPIMGRLWLDTDEGRLTYHLPFRVNASKDEVNPDGSRKLYYSASCRVQTEYKEERDPILEQRVTSAITLVSKRKEEELYGKTRAELWDAVKGKHIYACVEGALALSVAMGKCAGYLIDGVFDFTILKRKSHIDVDEVKRRNALERAALLAEMGDDDDDEDADADADADGDELLGGGPSPASGEGASAAAAGRGLLEDEDMFDAE